MLSEQTRTIIKSTVPVLEEHGIAITKVFYRDMFEAYPELLNIFTHANQKRGRQQAAPANTVYAAAVHIDNLEAILPAVIQIANKHLSPGVKPEHYPIVEEYLLKAIKEVLGTQQRMKSSKHGAKCMGSLPMPLSVLKKTCTKKPKTRKTAGLSSKISLLQAK